VQAEPRVPGRRRHAPDAAQVLQVRRRRRAGRVGVARRKSAVRPASSSEPWRRQDKTRRARRVVAVSSSLQ
jgi:hypothetical protein